MTTGITAPTSAPSAPSASPAPPSAEPGHTGSAGSGAGRRLRRHWATALLVCTAGFLGVLGPLLLSVYTGSISIPHNDTWAFSRTAQIFADTGHIVLFNWNAMSLLGMIVPLGPLGASITAQAFVIAGLALLALAAIFDLLRTYCGARRAALGLLIIAVWPGFGLISTSLMTDIPALVAVTVTLALGRRALERGSFPLLALAAVVGFWGFSVREQVIAAPLGVFAAALPRPEFRTRASIKRMVAILAPLCVLAAGFELWRRGMAGGGSPSFDYESFPGVGSVLMYILSGWLLLGLILSPLVFLVARPRSWGRRERRVAGVTFFVLANAALWFHLILPQNYLSVAGPYSGAFLGNRADVIPQTVWDVLTPLGCVSAALLAGALVGRMRRLRPELALYTLFMIAGTVLELIEGQVLFDRYVLPLALPIIALLLSEPLRRPDFSKRELRARVALGGAAGLFVAGLTSLMTANALAFDAATWHTAQQIVDSGKASAAYVDAGLDWTGYHSPNGMQDEGDLFALRDIYGYSPRLGHDQPCYVVASRPQSAPDWTLVATPTYRVYGFFGNEETLDVYRTQLFVCQ